MGPSSRGGTGSVVVPTTAVVTAIGLSWRLLAGVDDLEEIGLRATGVEARRGVAVLDGSLLAMGVISVPMSRRHTDRISATGEPCCCTMQSIFLVSPTSSAPSPCSGGVGGAVTTMLYPRATSTLLHDTRPFCEDELRRRRSSALEFLGLAAPAKPRTPSARPLDMPTSHFCASSHLDGVGLGRVGSGFVRCGLPLAAAPLVM